MLDQTDTINEILTRYADGPALLETALTGLTDSDLDLAPDSNSWSIRQIVHHIADGDDIWKLCIKAALGNGGGLFTLQWYWDKPQMEWSENWKYATRDIESSRALLHANRRHITELIHQTSDAWDRSIWLQRPDGQKEYITVGWIVEMQARHVVDHIKDIQAIRHAHNT